MVVELGEGSSGETPKASRRWGMARGWVFPPVNMVIASPMVQKESLIRGSKNNWAHPSLPPDNLTLRVKYEPINTHGNKMYKW